MTGLTLHSHVHYKEMYAHTCSGPLFSSVKPHSQRRGRPLLCTSETVKASEYGMYRQYSLGGDARVLEESGVEADEAGHAFEERARRIRRG